MNPGDEKQAAINLVGRNVRECAERSGCEFGMVLFTGIVPNAGRAVCGFAKSLDDCELAIQIGSLIDYMSMIVDLHEHEHGPGIRAMIEQAVANAAENRARSTNVIFAPGGLGT